MLRTTAERQGVKYSVHAAGRDTATNADAIHIAREGVATALVSIANRYMHSPKVMVSLADVDKTATLLADVCREVTSSTDFTVR
jgi:endoglucanase